MSASPQTKSSKVQWDGTAIREVSSGLLTWAVGAVSNQAAFVPVEDLCVVSARFFAPAAATSVTAKFNIGSIADPDAYLDAYTATDLAGLNEIPLTATEWVNKTFAKGVPVVFQLEAASAVGTIVIDLVLAPVNSVV